MNTFSVTLTINDCCCTKCCTSNRETTRIITNSTEFVSLQNGYYIRVLRATTNYALLEITNGSIYYIRKAFLNIPINLCLSDNCPVHKISITVTSITIS